MSNLLLKLATRSSPLAIVQAKSVARRLESVSPEQLSSLATSLDGAHQSESLDLSRYDLDGIQVELVQIQASADKNLDVPIGELAGQGVFVTEVDIAVLEGRADLGVHSAKDLPSSELMGGLLLAGVPDRADPRDVLVGKALDDLAPGAVVATGSARRRTQLAWLRPDLGFVEIRGNIARRLDLVPEKGAVVVAKAALDRLGLASRASQVLETDVMLPQVGQGALALRCRTEDAVTRALCAMIDDKHAHLAVRAERAFLARVGGGCEAPVAAYARLGGQLGKAGAEPVITLEALLASTDGKIVIRAERSGTDPEGLGTEVANWLLDHCGGRELVGQ